MKFALNHYWRFSSVWLAFAAGFCQLIMVVFVELLLYLIIVLSHEIIDVITHFLALYVISKLDEFLFSELADNEISNRVAQEEKFSPLRTISTTTSQNCGVGPHETLYPDLSAAKWINNKRK